MCDNHDLLHTFTRNLYLQDVDSTAAREYAEEIGAIYLETSAKDDQNVQDIFTQLSK
jgi:hypothetical protein